MAVHVTVDVAYDPNTQQFTFTGGNTSADDGTVDLDAGGGNSVTYEPKDNQDVWFLTGVSWNPEDEQVLWEWLNDIENGSIVVYDKVDATWTSRVEYSVTLDIEEVGTTQTMGGGPVIINRPPDGTAQLKSMSASR